MFNVNLNFQYSTSDGHGAQAYRSVEAEHEDRINVLLEAAKTGGLTTRTNDTDGTVTITAHGYANADVVDLFWSGGSRLGVAVSNVAANTFDISGGTGDNLPVVDTAVMTSKPDQTVAALDRSKTVAIIATGTGEWVFRTNSVAAPDDVFEFGERGGFVWSNDGVFAHPLTADVTSFYFSNARARPTTVEIRHLRTA